MINLALRTICRKGSIQNTVSVFSCQPQHAVNMFAGYDACLQAADKHFQHLLQTWWLKALYSCCEVDRLFFCRIVLCTVCKSYAHLIMLSLRLSVTHTICLHFYFLVSRPSMEGIQFPSIHFCLYMVTLNVYRASNVWGHQLPCAAVAVCRLSRTVTGSFEWSWTISGCGNDKTRNHKSRTPYISLVTTLFTVYAQ
jgi:hypothetical protein